jgi:hypothetical protein
MATGFFISQDNRPKRFQFVKIVSSNFPQFVDGSKTVWHVGQITGITPSSRKLQSPHGEIRRGFSVWNRIPGRQAVYYPWPVPVQRETAYVSRRSRRSLYQVSAIN